MTTRRSRHERGAIPFGRIFLVLLLATVGLAVWVGFPAATKAFRLRRATTIMAVRCLQRSQDCESEVTRFMSDAYTIHGVTLRRGDITMVGEPTAPEVRFEVRATLPFELPLVNRTIFRRFTIKGGAERPKGF